LRHAPENLQRFLEGATLLLGFSESNSTHRRHGSRL